ncbi:hypothetical protein ACHAWF_018112 [Thalassiosira exigua]
MGNRDINKMRIVDELGIGSYGEDQSLPQHGGVYWLNGRVCSGLPADPDDNVPSEDAAVRLKWMLRKTMGSVDAFELRRNELKRERIAILDVDNGSSCSLDSVKADDVDVTDDEVVQSYIHSCNPVHGIMSEYLTRAKLMIRFGPVLFVHGAVPFSKNHSDVNESLEFPTPWVQPNSSHEAGATCKSLSDWADALNDFASNQVKGWKEYHEYLAGGKSKPLCGVWATEGGYFNTSSRSGKLFGSLMQYGMGTLPDRSKTQSCVYNSWMHDGLPREDLFGSVESMRKVFKLFEREGIRLILSGHQPIGDAPWPIQVSQNGDDTKLWIIPCDTSFSGDTSWTSLQGYESCESKSLGRGLGTSGRGEVALR